MAIDFYNDSRSWRLNSITATTNQISANQDAIANLLNLDGTVSSPKLAQAGQ